MALTTRNVASPVLIIPLQSQALHRGYVARREALVRKGQYDRFVAQNKAACTLQAVRRGQLGRRKARRARKEKLVENHKTAERKLKAACALQAARRGQLGRRTARRARKLKFAEDCKATERKRNHAALRVQVR